MALRGWRFIGVAGTIIVYVAGILVLSIVSLNSPNPRRSRAGRFGEFEHINKQRESNLLGKRQPLQWCQELKFKDNINNKNNAVLHTSQKPIKVMQTFPGHFVRYNKYVVLRNLNEKFDDKFIDNSVAIDSKQRINNEIKINVEKLWQSNKEKTMLAQQNDIRKNIDKDNNNKLQPPKLIALASFPGSGNTWLRYLLQQSTGILTGSVYKDFGLLKSGFPGEHVFNSSVLVVKTHEWGPNSWGNFSKAILLIRDPDKAILAEFNRQSGGHVGFASPDRYKRTKGRYWQQFVTNKLWAWEQMNMQWAKNFTGDVLIVYYDDLVENVEVLLRKILNFINFPIDEELLACALLRKEGIYRRKKRMNSFDPYTPEMHRALNEIQKEVYTALGRF